MSLSPQPAVPLTTVALVNPFGVTASVAITGGTTTFIFVNGVQVGTTTPANVQVPPGGTISITYSAAPTWAWTNPPVYQPPPGYSAAGMPGPNELTNFEYPTHAVSGLSGWGFGVSN